MRAEREAMIKLHRAGYTNSEIVKLIKVPRSTVHHTGKRFKELGNLADRPRSGRPRSTRTPKLVKAVEARIKRNPQGSMRKMAREMDVDEKNMRNVVKTDLKLSPLKMRNCQHLTDLQKEK